MGVLSQKIALRLQFQANPDGTILAQYNITGIELLCEARGSFEIGLR
jgi:hypothetical protein